MKPDIHPEYRKVLFHDTSSDTFFLVGSDGTNDTDQGIRGTDLSLHDY